MSGLKKPSLSFTQSNEFHISRGNFFAITEPLREKIEGDRIRLNELEEALKQKNINLNELEEALELKSNNLDELLTVLQQKNINLDDLFAAIGHKEINLENLKKVLEPARISLAELQDALENNYHINNKETLSFIILCLVEPIWIIPGSLSALATSLLDPINYRCCNLSGKDLKKDRLQINKKTDSNSIELSSNLYIMEKNNENPIEGYAAICFSIEETIPVQVKLLPITMQFNFSDEQRSKQFQQELAKNYKGWLLNQNESDYIPIKLDKWRTIQMDFWIIPILMGLLAGLIAMISFSALGLMSISPLLLPPLGLALGLCLAGVMNTYAQINIKKELDKSHRPIHLQDTGFFNHSAPLNSPITDETQCILNK